MRGLGHGTASGAPPVRQPIRNKDVIPNAQLHLAAASEQQRRQTEKVKAQTYPLPKNSAYSGPRSTQPPKAIQKTDLQRKEDKKYLRCSLTWFCRLSAKNSLPVFIFISTTTWNEKRERKKKKKLFELETCERTGFNFIRPPGTPFNSMQYSAMVRYDRKHCLTNICEYCAVLRVCNLNRAIALRFNIELKKTL